MAKSDTEVGAPDDDQRPCRGCGHHRNLIQKYDVRLCRACFEEVAAEAGFALSERHDAADDSTLDEWEALRTVTQETRAGILADIVGHPKGMASVRELDHSNPRVERSAIEEHLRTLVNAGVVAKEQLPVGERSRDLPYTFYRVTDAARDLFDRNRIFDRETWRDQYARVEKPDDVVAAEKADRPDTE
jgi:ribosomal protein S14/DNA-binding HxlR family transcriptional regulator